MDAYLAFLILGLASGAVFASLGVALLTTYRSSGVVNFATGGIALLAAYWFGYFREGKLFCPIPWLPTTVDIGFVPSVFLAAVMAVALTSIFGLLLYYAVFRALRSSPSVASAVASIGVLVVIINVLAVRLGTDPTISVRSYLPQRSFTLGNSSFSEDRLWMAGSVLVLASVLVLVDRFTRFGLLTRAVASNEKGSYVSGISPQKIAAINWMITAAVAAVAGILIVPLVPLVPAAYTLFIVPALAAAVVGGFESIIIAAIAGLAIGSIQAVATLTESRFTWLPSSGVAEFVPLALLLMVLVIRAKPLPSRGVLPLRQTLGRAPRPRFIVAPAVVLSVIAGVLLVTTQGQWRVSVATSLIFVIMGLSWVVITGFAGQISFAQLALAGSSAFLLSYLTRGHIAFPFAPLLAATGAALIGVLVGLPALRVRGLSLSIVTLALAAFLSAAWFANPDFSSVDGEPVVPPKLFGLDLSVGSGTAFPRLSFCFMVLVVTVASAVGVALLRRSRLGLRMLAVRASERSAAATGINVVRTKIIAFAVASFLAGVAGSLLAYRQSSVTYVPFDVVVALAFFAVLYMTGITSVSGAVLAGLFTAGGLVYYGIQQWLGSGGWYQVVSGIGLIVAVITQPEGAVGAALMTWRQWRGGESGSGANIDLSVRRNVTASPPAASHHPAPAAAPILLELDDIVVRYGGVVAVDGVSLRIREGRIVGLIGPNGAGKTTLVDAVTGLVPCSGSIRLDGQRLDGRTPHIRARAGLSRTFQGIDLDNDLSVRENVAVGVAGQPGRAKRIEAVDAALALLGLEEVGDVPAGELSQGHRQLISLARAIVSRPKIALLDEPAAGLNAVESEWLGGILRRVRAAGITIVLIDHDMHLVFNLCDDVMVLDFGRVLAEGPPSEIRENPSVVKAYLGSSLQLEPESETVGEAVVPTPGEASPTLPGGQR